LTKYQIITEIECKYQIAETEGKMKYQDNYRNWIQISNCRDRKKDEKPNFAETEDKISIQKIFGALP
jgi:hypothetical protein